jgi:uncharacterized membrane protein YbhN (UPF0104 family)
MAARAEALPRRHRGGPFGGRSRRSVVLRIALLVVVLGCLALLIVDLVPGSSKRVENARAGWLAAEAALEVIACLAYAWLFHAVFAYRANTKTFARSAQIGVGELGAFAVVPTGVGGPALRVWALMRDGMSLRQIVVGSVAHAAIFNAPYVVAALVLGMSTILGVGPGQAPAAVALAPLALVLVTTALGAGASRHVSGRRSEPSTGWRSTALEAMRTVPDGLREIPGRLRIPGSSLGAIGYWAGDFGVLVVAFHAAGGSAPIGVVALAYMLGQLGNALPLPGGVGGVEPLMLGVLISSGVDSGLGAAAVVLYRLVSLGTQGVVGTAAVATLVRSLRHPA